MLAMLPMLATALTGSGGGEGGASDGAGPARIQDAIHILEQLRNTYGTTDNTPSETTTDPTSSPTPNEGSTTGPASGSGSGSAADALKAHQLYQHNAAAAFNAIDNTLAHDITTFADGHTIDHTQINALLHAVDTALAHLGSAALLTTTGQHQATHILTTALTQAEKLAGNTTTNATHIHQLTNQYLLILSGENTGATADPHGSTGGTVGQWIDSALQVMKKLGYDTSTIDPSDIATIIEHESGGNPHAVNGTDSNAAAGHPSKGLMQTIDSTFREYAAPGYTDIYDPVSNIVAGVRYSIARYGSVSNVPGVRAVHAGNSYVGY